jgi:hypothetical protein
MVPVQQAKEISAQYIAAARPANVHLAEAAGK